MIRRRFNLIASAALLTALLAGPASAQGKKVTTAMPGRDME